MGERLGFIGLGIMGRGMASNLLKAGYDVRVWNRTAGRMNDLVETGASMATSPADLAAKCDVILICVSDTADVEEVVLGQDGIIHTARPGSLVVDHSTISPHTTREIAARLYAREVHMLDAPVSGGSEGAANGTLSIMIGGAADQVERAMPYLQSMGKTITHVGEQGAGQMTKLVNQILAVGNTLAMSEALLFAQAGGLDLEKALNAISGGAAGSWILEARGPQILERDFRPGFTIDLQQKDLWLALQAADMLGVPTLVTNIVFDLYRTLQTRGMGGEGNHALIKALEHLADIEVGGR